MVVNDLKFSNVTCRFDSRLVLVVYVERGLGLVWVSRILDQSSLPEEISVMYQQGTLLHIELVQSLTVLHHDS